MERGNAETWREAVRICGECPLFVQCAELAGALAAKGQRPRAMIWAGVAYDGAGAVIQDLEWYRPDSRHSRGLRVIRTSSRPCATTAPISAPRRHLVLGRPLGSTGTNGS
ncbi:hypothetical protein [Nocardia neocaledoniensis]|nr:hypothetical protein [Nocardia neocaledoniensis]